jgi:hypothetical protein
VAPTNLKLYLLLLVVTHKPAASETIVEEPSAALRRRRRRRRAKNARALQLAQKKQVVNVPRQQREQHEDDAIERGPFPRVEHINARPQAPVVVFEFHIIYDASSLRGRGDPVAVRRHGVPRSSLLLGRTPRSRAAARSVVKKSVTSTTSAPRRRQRARFAAWRWRKSSAAALVLARRAALARADAERKLSSNLSSRAAQAASRLLSSLRRLASVLQR